MEPKELEKLHKDMLDEKKRLEAELGDFTEKNPQVEGDYESHFHKNDSSDTADEKAQSVTEFEREKALEYDLELRLKEVNEALTNVEKGEYGKCAHCKQNIQAKRLKAMPTAKFCVDCAERASLV